MNDHHDARSIHATYFERLCHVREVLPNHQTSRATIYKTLKQEFIGTWYQNDVNLKKAALTIKAFDNKPEVKYFSPVQRRTLTF